MQGRLRGVRNVAADWCPPPFNSQHFVGSGVTRHYSRSLLRGAKGAFDNRPQFQLRVSGAMRIRPNGTAEFRRFSTSLHVLSWTLSAAPVGLGSFAALNPQLKLRAIFECPCGTGRHKASTRLFGFRASDFFRISGIRVQTNKCQRAGSGDRRSGGCPFNPKLSTLNCFSFLNRWRSTIKRRGWQDIVFCHFLLEVHWYFLIINLSSVRCRSVPICEHWLKSRVCAWQYVFSYCGCIRRLAFTPGDSSPLRRRIWR